MAQALRIAEEAAPAPTKKTWSRKPKPVGAVQREDSDDELGLDDHPWEWIYEKALYAPSNVTKRSASASVDGEVDPSTPSKRKRKAEVLTANAGPTIIGARMGNFECQLGDCCLLKAEGTSEAWVGLICEFVEDEESGEKQANFMWFSTAREIRNKQKRRTDALPNELYITPSWDRNPLASINGRATVLSQEAFLKRWPGGKVPRSSREYYGKVFVCRRGCSTRTATYTDEFLWEEIYRGKEDLDRLIELVRGGTKATRKRRDRAQAEKDEVGDVDYVQAGEDREADADTPSTPKKRQKTSSVSATPKSQRRSALTTPTHKRILLKKALEFTPLGTRVLSPTNYMSSPFQLARHNLHVSAVPATLPCREDEFASVYAHLEAAITDGTGACIYISGTPGTGKTATVREVVAQLDASVQAEELDDFIFVEINGMKVTDPHQSYSLLWEAIHGDRVSPSHALDLLEREFSHPSPRRVPCVVLMDELDQLVTRNQSVMYNFFNWPALRHSRLIVLAVANTMDLPERTLSNKISSRLGLTRVTFPGYSHQQLMKIIEARLEGVPGNIVDPDAVQFASRKVAAVSGDARRALDICRRAVEIAEDEARTQELDSVPPTPSKKEREKQNSDIDELATKPKRPSRVTIATIKRAINEATSSPLQQHLRSLPLASKLFLAAILARTRRTGIAETILGDVVSEAKRIGNMTENTQIHDFLLSENGKANNTLFKGAAAENTGKGTSFGAAAGGGAGKGSKATNRKVPRVLALGAAAMELMAAGVINVEARRGERTGKVRLCVGEEELKLAYRDDPEVGGLGFTV